MPHGDFRPDFVLVGDRPCMSGIDRRGMTDRRLCLTLGVRRRGNQKRCGKQGGKQGFHGLIRELRAMRMTVVPLVSIRKWNI